MDQLRHRPPADWSDGLQRTEPALKIRIKPGKDALEKAVQAVRKTRAEHPAQGVLVELSGGNYKVQSPVRLGPSESGLQGAPVIFRSAPGERAIIDGSIEIPRAMWKKISGDDDILERLPDPSLVLCADAKDIGITIPPMDEGYGEGYCDPRHVREFNRPGNYYPQLFFDGQPLEVARYPKTGWLITDGGTTENCPLADCGRPLFDFTCRDEGLWKIRDIDSTFYHGAPRYDWAFIASPVGVDDRKACRLRLKGCASYDFIEGKRFYLSRVPECLDEPGTYIIDPKKGRIYLVPPKGFDERDVCVSFAQDTLIDCRDASFITFQDMDFAYTRGCGVMIHGGQSVRLEGCSLYDIGYLAVWIGTSESRGIHFTDRVCNGGYDHAIHSCDIYNCGFGGVYISAGDRVDLRSCNVRVENCDFHDFGYIGLAYCFAVYLTSIGAYVGHNRFHAGPHAAIWFDGNENVMEYNEFYDLLRISDDASCIYCGRDYSMGGNIIRYNLFHDVKSDAVTICSVFGTYCDDNSASLCVYGNIYYHLKEAHLSHGGHDIVFENNLIAYGVEEKPAQSVRFVGYGYPETLSGEGQHVVCLKNAPTESPAWRTHYPHLYEYMAWDPETEGRFPHYCSYRHNVFYRHGPIMVNFDWQNEKFHNVMEANTELDCDPLFVDEEHLDLRLRDDSPVFAKDPGFKQIPCDKIGLYNNAFRHNA
ncbi:MAG: right-handed parallel beta-helix repeat-containing protein [Clostridia bacterium]|nr:right-handed parallel beta-helix repeat-containing protein [Clostridia bacterium]